MGSFCHQGTCYHVETRARVIFFDMGPFEASGVLQRKPSSWISHSVDLPKSQSREHGGLMSWPEHFYKHPRHPDGNHKQAKSLSERAMKLSIFGSMVSIPRRHNQSFPRYSHAKPYHSLSYPRISSTTTYVRPLVSFQSAGATTNNSLRAREFPEPKPIPPSRSSRKEGCIGDDSSDESGPEDELIVRIDSPSRLSFQQPSGHLLHMHPEGS